jgi:hypothetical protein
VRAFGNINKLSTIKIEVSHINFTKPGLANGRHVSSQSKAALALAYYRALFARFEDRSRVCFAIEPIDVYRLQSLAGNDWTGQFKANLTRFVQALALEWSEERIKHKVSQLASLFENDPVAQFGNSLECHVADVNGATVKGKATFSFSFGKSSRPKVISFGEPGSLGGCNRIPPCRVHFASSQLFPSLFKTLGSSLFGVPLLFVVTRANLGKCVVLANSNVHRQDEDGDGLVDRRLVFLPKGIQVVDFAWLRDNHDASVDGKELHVFMGGCRAFNHMG